MKLISWNVNGLRAVMGKGFAEIFEGFDADCVCLQETKLQEGQIDLAFLGYSSYWNYADKKGYSGTVIFTRKSPLSVSYGIRKDEHDHEGRAVTLEFNDFYLVCVYVPNSQDELKRLDYRMTWEDDFRAYLCSLATEGNLLEDGSRRPAKAVVVCGDMNVAHKEIDLKNPKTNHFNPGFTDEERAKMTTLLDAGFIDTFRHFHADEVDRYSWWSYRMKARERNVGWRIDYFLASGKALEETSGNKGIDLSARLVSADILDQVMGSDHCPVELVLDCN